MCHSDLQKYIYYKNDINSFTFHVQDLTKDYGCIMFYSGRPYAQACMIYASNLSCSVHSKIHTLFAVMAIL